MEREQSDIIQLKVRMKESMRAQLEKIAQTRAISMNAEIVDRLERSFRDQALLLDAMELTYGTGLAGILLLLGEVMKTTGSHAGFHSVRTLEGSQNWWNDPYAFDQVVKGANRVLEAFRPSGDADLVPFAVETIGDPIPSDRDIDLNLAFKHLGEGFANGILREVADDKPTTTTAIERAPRMRRALGMLVSRVKEFVGRRS